MVDRYPDNLYIANVTEHINSLTATGTYIDILDDECPYKVSVRRRVNELVLSKPSKAFICGIKRHII